MEPLRLCETLRGFEGKWVGPQTQRPGRGRASSRSQGPLDGRQHQQHSTGPEEHHREAPGEIRAGRPAGASIAVPHPVVKEEPGCHQGNAENLYGAAHVSSLQVPVVSTTPTTRHRRPNTRTRVRAWFRAGLVAGGVSSCAMACPGLGGGAGRLGRRVAAGTPPGWCTGVPDQPTQGQDEHRRDGFGDAEQGQQGRAPQQGVAGQGEAWAQAADDGDGCRAEQGAGAERRSEQAVADGAGVEHVAAVQGQGGLELVRAFL
jgi:hypothetical protein